MGTEVADSAAVSAILTLHRPVQAHGWGTSFEKCSHCQQADGWPVHYPCPTVTAIRTALEGAPE